MHPPLTRRRNLPLELSDERPGNVRVKLQGAARTAERELVCAALASEQRMHVLSQDFIEISGDGLPSRSSCCAGLAFLLSMQ